MFKILITEFINNDSLKKLKKVFKVHYDEKLWQYPKNISKIIIVTIKIKIDLIKKLSFKIKFSAKKLKNKETDNNVINKKGKPLLRL